MFLLPHFRGQGKLPRVPYCDCAGTAERSDPASEVGGGDERSYPASGVRGGDERSYPASGVRGGGQEELPHAGGQGWRRGGATPRSRTVTARAQEDLEELSHVEGQEGRW